MVRLCKGMNTYLNIRIKSTNNKHRKLIEITDSTSDDVGFQGVLGIGRVTASIPDYLVPTGSEGLVIHWIVVRYYG